VARRLTLAAAAVVSVPAAWLYWQMLWPPALPPPPPGKTHYDRILAIVRGLNIDPSDWSSQSTDDVAAAAVDELVVLLAEPNHWTNEALEDTRKVGRSSSAMSKREHETLRVLLQTARESALSRGEYDRACDLTIAMLNLEIMNSRARSSLGYEGKRGDYFLHIPRSQTSPASARKIIDTLEQALAGRESAAVTRTRWMVFHERQVSWPVRLEFVLTRREVPAYYLSSWEQNNSNLESRFRALQVFYAVKLFHDQHGRLPATLDELSPEFLPALPRDQFSDEPMRYVVEGEKYRLYSVGPNGVDDGGSGDDRDFSWQGFQK
jgi:hypothetical protein